MRISDSSSDVCSSDLLVRAIMQNRARDARLGGIGRKGDTSKVERELGPVLRIELPQLDEDRASLVRPGNVPGADRIADISLRRIIAMLVLEDSLEHDELIAPIVGMCGEMARGRIADEIGRAHV